MLEGPVTEVLSQLHSALLFGSAALNVVVTILQDVNANNLNINKDK